MALLRFPQLNRLFHQEHVTCWFSSQALLLSWEKKKQRVPLSAGSGFADSQVEDVERAAATLTEILTRPDTTERRPLVLRSATVFVASNSSPLERQLVRRAFQKSGIQKISLVSYATAVRTFAQRQNITAGVGIVVGPDGAEAVLFSPEHQLTVALDLSLIATQEVVIEWLREELQLEISAESAHKLYQAFGKKKEDVAHTVRGRNTRTEVVETRTISTTEANKLRRFLLDRIGRELREVVGAKLFPTVQAQRWVIVGDAFLQQAVGDLFQAETVFLASEFDLIQGVTWLS